MKGIAAGLLVAGLTMGTMVGLSGAAFADGGCPSGGDWFLASTGFAIDSLDNGSVQDQNGDGLACFKVNAGQTKKHDEVSSFTWKDNTN
jgi:heme A synthase